MEINEIQALANEKYKSWEWNYGYSPRYQYNGIINTSNASLHFTISVKNGMIEDFNSKSELILARLQPILIGQAHQEKALRELFSNHIDLFEELKISSANLINAFFG